FRTCCAGAATPATTFRTFLPATGSGSSGKPGPTVSFTPQLSLNAWQEKFRPALQLRVKTRTMGMTRAADNVGPAVRLGPEVPKMNPYSSLCDDFGVYVYLNTKMELPSGRETVLHFFDSLQKSFPQMTDFDRRENGEFVLEEDREKGSY